MNKKGIKIDFGKFYLGYFVYVNYSLNNCYGIIQLIEKSAYPYKKINLVYASRRQIEKENGVEFLLKFKTNDYVIFKIKESDNLLFNYEAIEAVKPEEMTDFLRSEFNKLPHFSKIKWLCLGMNQELLNEYINEQTKEWKEKISKVREIFNSKTVDKIRNSLIVDIETVGGNKPGDDDSMSAFLRAEFPDFEGIEHSYIREKFGGYNKEVFSDRGFTPYRRMIEDYKASEKYIEHLNLAAEIKSYILKEIEIKYSLENHRASYLRICNQKIKNVESEIKKKIVPNESNLLDNDWY